MIKPFKEGANVANLHCHWRSRLTPDPLPAAVLIWPPIRSLGFSPWHLLRKWLPPLFAAHCMLILKSNKRGRLNCISQPGVCGEGIILTGCRCAPAKVASPHEAHRGRDIKWRWHQDNRRGVTGEVLKCEERETGRKEGSMGSKTQKPLRTRLQHSRCYYTPPLNLLTSVSPLKLDL